MLNIEIPSSKEPKKESTNIWNKIKEEVDPNQEKLLANFEKELEEGIEDPQEAAEKIDELRKIFYPVISIPVEYYDEAKKRGYISAKPDWTGHRSLAATIGRAPYSRKDEERVFLKIKPHIHVLPRFTSSKSENKKLAFRGVVMLPENNLRLRLSEDLEEI